MMASMRDNTFGARLGQVIEQRELTQGQVELKTGLGRRGRVGSDAELWQTHGHAQQQQSLSLHLVGA